MTKKLMSIFLVMLMLAALCACGITQPGKDQDAAPDQTAGKDKPAESGETQVTKEMAKLTISGVVGSPGGDLTGPEKLLKEKYPALEVEYITCDAVNREQILKTAISAGAPPTVGFYWATRLRSFYGIGMCLDLRDYLDQSYFDKINKDMQSVNVGANGEQFGVSYSAVYFTTFYNKDMFDKYGFSIPETWDDLTKIFETLKKDGIFGFATNSATMQDCLYAMVFSELEDKVGPGTSKGIADGTISVAPGSPAGEVIRSFIEQIKVWYDAGYWYPGEGGINTTADDVNAAFAQERCLCVFNFSGAFATHEQSCDFEISTFMMPTSRKGMDKYMHMEPSVLFIPSNASKDQINTAIEFFKVILSEEGQQAVVNSNNLPAVPSYTYKDISPVFQGIINEMEVETNHFGPFNPTRTSSEMQTFIKQQIFAAPLSGAMTIDETLNEMERIKQEAVEAQKNN